jgi:uncharacterized protein (TIGR02145 family)
MSKIEKANDETRANAVKKYKRYLRCMNFKVILACCLLLFFASCGGDHAGEHLEDEDKITIVTTTQGALHKGKVVENEDDYIVLETEALGRVQIQKQLIVSIRQMYYGSFIDQRDGRRYEWIEVGGLRWMTANLNFDAEGSFCPLDDCDMTDDYGRLYPWKLACDVCPDGWRLPTDEEWKQLEISLGMEEPTADEKGYRGSAEAGLLREGGSSGMVIPMGGARYGSSDYRGGGDFAYLWTSSEHVVNYAWARVIYRKNDQVNRNYYDKDYAFSVRCVRDM